MTLGVISCKDRGFPESLEVTLLKRRPSLWVKVLVTLLIAELTLPTAAFRTAYAGAPRNAFPLVPQGKGATPTVGRFSKTLAPALADPWIETLQAIPEIPFEIGLLSDDPTLDKDPFFIRSQRWLVGEVAEIPSSPESELYPPFAYWLTPKGFALKRQGASSVWEVDVPLTPIYFTGDYVVLAARDPSFFSHTRYQGEIAQGIFLVSLEELEAAEKGRDRIPLYFFPLPGDGWTGAVTALGFPAKELLVLTNEQGLALPVQEQDIETIVWAAKLNLALAQGAAARAGALKHGSNPTFELLPGSTAGFGLLFTGFHPTDSELNILPTATRYGLLDRALRLLGRLGPTTALANDDEVAKANEKLVSNLIRVATVTSLAFAAAIVFKYTFFRNHFKELHKEQTSPSSWWSWLKREGKDVGDVFAHNLTFLANVAKVWFGNSVEYIIDRHFPRLGAGKNSLTRKFLDKTVYFSRDTGRSLAVNLRTAILGSGVLGMTDSALVAVQLYFVVPWIAQAVAEGIPSTAEKVERVFDIGNPHMETYNRNEVIRNLAAYITSGASAFSSDLKSQLLVTLGPEVDNELRKQGLDPDNPQVKALRDKKLNELLAEVEKQMGLPGREEFLYDAATIWSQASSLLGYSRPEELRQGENALVNFQGESRPGLVLTAAKDTLKELRARHKADPTDTLLQSAVKLAEEMVGNLTYLSHFAKYPWRYLVGKLRGRAPPSVADLVQKIRWTRRQLIAWTYDGNLNDELKSLPSPWTQAFGESSTQLLGHCFRRAFFARLSGDKKLLKGPSQEARANTAALLPGFELEALQTLITRHPKDFEATLQKANGNKTQAEQEFRHTHRAEFRLIVDEKILSRIAADKDTATPYQPTRKGWFVRWQERRAKREAAKQFQAKFQKPFDARLCTPDELVAWKQLYGEAMLQRAGIYPDYNAIPELQERVEKKASDLSQAQLNDPKVKAFLAPLSVEDQVDFTASIYAENLALAYREIVPNIPDEEAQRLFREKFGKAYKPTDASKEETKAFREFYVSAALSTAQPGRFQWLRQTKWVRNSRFLTRFARGVEALFPVEGHKAGLYSWLTRQVPGLHDLMVGNLRVYRNAITAAVPIYWFNYFLWGVGLPMPLWLLNLAFGFMIASPAQFMTRFFRMQGAQPMGKWQSMALYAFIYSWVTFWGSFPTLWYAEDATKLIGPVQQAVSQTVENGWDAMTNTCADFLNNAGQR